MRPHKLADCVKENFTSKTENVYQLKLQFHRAKFLRPAALVRSVTTITLFKETKPNANW